MTYTIYTTDDRNIIRRASGYEWDFRAGAEHFKENLPGLRHKYFVAPIGADEKAKHKTKEERC